MASSKCLLNTDRQEAPISLSGSLLIVFDLRGGTEIFPNARSEPPMVQLCTASYHWSERRNQHVPPFPFLESCREQ